MEKTIQDKLNIRHANTLHGLNPFSSKGHIVGLIFIYKQHGFSPNYCTKELTAEDSSNYQSRLIDKLAENNIIVDQDEVYLSSSYAGEFLGVGLKYRNYSPEIINTCLSLGLCIRMQTNLQTFYRPQDAPFSLETSEKLSLRNLNDVFGKYPDLLESKAWLYGDVRMWITDEGKQFAQKVRQRFPECIKEADEEHYLLLSELDNPLLDFPMQAVNNPSVSPATDDVKKDDVKKDDVKSVGTNVERVDVKSAEINMERVDVKSTEINIEKMEDDNMLCIMCMENEKNIAFNCGHVLLCEKCESKVSLCPACRKVINTRIKIFI